MYITARVYIESVLSWSLSSRQGVPTNGASSTTNHPHQQQAILISNKASLSATNHLYQQQTIQFHKAKQII